MTKAIYFDMDGTIADLYGVENWLDYLVAGKTKPYREAKPLVDMRKLARLLNSLQEQGWTIGIISWLAKSGSDEYGDKVAKAAGGAYASAISIVSVVDGDDGYVVTLSAAISGLAVGDVIGEVVKDGSNNSAFPVGTALTISPVEVKQEEILAMVHASSVVFSPSMPPSCLTTACSSKPTRQFVSPTANKEVTNGKQVDFCR